MTHKMTRKSKLSWITAFFFVLTTITTTTWADDVADVTKLIQAGQYAEAMQKADTYLTQHPKDAHMRFMKGLILAEQNKTSEAIAVFSKLTEDYPELPEPYNNLAVLFASINQYDKARASLEMAIRTNPSYSTAHENLGDVYAKLASQAYDKALQLDSGNSGAKLKLNLIHNLFSNSNSAINNPASVPAKTAPAQQVAAAKPVATTPVKVPAAPAASPVPVKPAAAEPAKSAPAKVEAVKPEPKAAPANTDQDEVLKVVTGWAQAWSSKNTNAYLANYANDFQTPNGISHKAWADERRLRIEGKGHLSVKIESPKVSVDGNTATVRFRQIYTSDQLKADSRKTLVLSRQDGKWLITQERSGG